MSQAGINSDDESADVNVLHHAGDICWAVHCWIILNISVLLPLQEQASENFCLSVLYMHKLF